MGQPSRSNVLESCTEYIGAGGEPREVKHLSTWRKGNQTETPLVVASEKGIAQTSLALQAGVVGLQRGRPRAIRTAWKG